MTEERYEYWLVERVRGGVLAWLDEWGDYCRTRDLARRFYWREMAAEAAAPGDAVVRVRGVRRRVKR